MASRERSIAVVAVAEVLALGLWFSASAVVPALRLEVELDPTQASLFTSAVQMGFVVGTLTSAGLGLADRLDPRRFFAVSAAIAALANAAILLVEPTSPVVIAMRFVTGACMAGIYPVGMKLVTTWAKGDTGWLVGLLVGALTLGSAAPHLFNALGGVDWRFTLATASIAALLAAALIGQAGIGPATTPPRPFRPALALRAWTTPSLRLANLGYLGHMWELYAMWAWIGFFLDSSFRAAMAVPDAGTGVAGKASFWAALVTFATIAAGGLGSIVAGRLADRLGRTRITMIAMAVSGSCALVTGFLFGANPWLLTALCLLWGTAVVADSAQFSASVAELSEPDLVGTMLTMQTSLGFFLTLVTIHMLPPLVEMAGWGVAFASLALGPALGIIAMSRLRAHPDAHKLASGFL